MYVWTCIHVRWRNCAQMYVCMYVVRSSPISEWNTLYPYSLVMTNTRRDVSEVTVSGMTAPILDCTMISLIYQEHYVLLYDYKNILSLLSIAHLHHVLRFYVEVQLIIHGLLPPFQQLTEYLHRSNMVS